MLVFIIHGVATRDANYSKPLENLSLGQEHAAMALGVTDGHISYWHSDVAARLLAANLLGDIKAIDAQKIDVE